MLTFRITLLTSVVVVNVLLNIAKIDNKIRNKCISITDCAPGECCDTNGKCRKNCFTPEVPGAGANTCKNNSDCRSQYYGSTLKYCCRGITSYSGSRSCGADCIGIIRVNPARIVHQGNAVSRINVIVVPKTVWPVG